MALSNGVRHLTLLLCVWHGHVGQSRQRRTATCSATCHGHWQVNLNLPLAHNSTTPFKLEAHPRSYLPSLSPRRRAPAASLVDKLSGQRPGVVLRCFIDVNGDGRSRRPRPPPAFSTPGPATSPAGGGYQSCPLGNFSSWAAVGRFLSLA